MKKQCLLASVDFYYVEVSGPAASELVQLTTGKWSASFIGERSTLDDPATALL